MVSCGLVVLVVLVWVAGGSIASLSFHHGVVSVVRTCDRRHFCFACLYLHTQSAQVRVVANIMLTYAMTLHARIPPLPQTRTWTEGMRVGRPAVDID